MDSNKNLSDPVSSKIATSFIVGILIGVILAFPAIQSGLGLVQVGSGGAISRVLIVGVLAIGSVTVGLFGLYQFFVLVDKSILSFKAETARGVLYIRGDQRDSPDDDPDTDHIQRKQYEPSFHSRNTDVLQMLDGPNVVDGWMDLYVVVIR